MDMLKYSLSQSIDDNIAVLKERERRAAEDRYAEREPELSEAPMNRAARRRAEKLARKRQPA